MNAILRTSYFTLDELAQECGVSTRTVQRWINATVPGLPVTRLGGRPLVARTDFAGWLASRRTQRNAVPAHGRH
jgi:excisionase family DNA binding protein